MFDFLKNIDIKLVSIISQLENDMKYKSGNTLVTIQTYCELLMKQIEYEETGYKRRRKPLGEYLADNFFKDILLNDLYVDTRKLSEINKDANLVKHNGEYNFNESKLKDYVHFIFDISKSVYKNYFHDYEEDPIYDENYFDNLLNFSEQDKTRIRQSYNEQLDAKTKEYEFALNNALAQKEILERRIKETEKEKDYYKEQIDNLHKLETQLRLKDKKITELRQSRAKIEEKLNEKESDEKKQLEKEIKSLKSEKIVLKQEIAELRSRDIIDPKIKIDRDFKILEEKNKEIEELKALISNQEMVQDEKIFKLYKKNAMQLGFSSSYSNDDSYFVVTGVGKEIYCTSKYKSFYAVLNNLLQRGTVIKASAFLKNKNITEKDLKEIFRIEISILSLMRNNKLKDKKWSLNYMSGKKENLKLACEDIIQWMKLLTSISNVQYIEPELELFNTLYNDDYINIKYDNKLSYENNIYNIIDCIMVEDEDNDDFFSIWIDDYIKYNVNKSKLTNLENILKEIFGFEHFNDGQFEILKHTMNVGNTIGILPTGGGKSLIYQFASLLEPKITIIVDPINSLIKDQIDGLNNKFGINRCLNLTSSNENMIEDMRKLRNSNAMFVFLSPERFQIDSFRQILYSLSFNNSIERIVLDEVHCLSEWGHDFRIPYLMLADTLKSCCGDRIKYLGLTATAAANVINDLIIELGMDMNDVVFLKQLRRENLTFHFNSFNNPSDMSKSLLERIEKIDTKLNGDKTNSVIVFTRTVKGSKYSATSLEDAKELLYPLYSDRLGVYYGQLSQESKDISQDNFINNDKSILIATKAFGMGIDKPNIRCTVHYGMPNSFEAFYQEAGRAGRDKKPADCYIYTYKYSQEDRKNINDFFDDSSDVSEMKRLSGYLRDTDLNTNIWFFTNGLISPTEEATRAYGLYKYLIEAQDINNIYIKDNNSWEIEKILYILHKLGIVSNWEKNYSVYSLNVHLSSYYNDINFIKNEANKYISQYKDFKDVHDKIEAIISINQLYDLILIIRQWYFRNFVLGRKNQLYNMIDKIDKFSNRECSEDIQKEIDSYFDLTNIIFKTDEGYSLKFENESLSEVVEYIAELEESLLNKRQIEMERILESITTNNISLYTSLLFLRKGQFDSRNGKQRFEHVYNAVSDEDKVEIMISLADKMYSLLDDEKKEILLNTLYHLDYSRLRSVFLEHIKTDSVNKKYWLSYINTKINKILRGGKKYE